MPANPNAPSFGGVAYVHKEPEGTRRLIDIPELYWPDDTTWLNFDVTARRTLESQSESPDNPHVYILGMYHAALLNVLMELGDENQDREMWQPIQRINEFMSDPANKLIRLHPTSLFRAIRALDSIITDDALLPGALFIEREAKATRTTKYRISPVIGFRDLRPKQNHNTHEN